MKNPQKLYVVRKYISAKSAAEAIRKDKTHPVDDVWMDEDFKNKKLADAMGFTIESPQDDEV